jgi:hypothetical protein
MWRLIFSFLTFLNIWQFIYPFLIKFEIKCNILKLKGVFLIKLFNKIKFEFKFRIKNGYIYIYFKNKEIKEKISKQNVNVIFIFNLIKQIYFRHQLLNCNLISNFGYSLNSCVSATVCGYIDVFSKCIFSKIKNNKKSAHIFVCVQPKYNEDIFNFRFVYEIRMSFFDILYTFIYAIFKTISRKLNKKKEV